jgi:hypothetical protein
MGNPKATTENSPGTQHFFGFSENEIFTVVQKILEKIEEKDYFLRANK